MAKAEAARSKFIAAIVTGSSLEEACKAAGIGRTTAWEWRKDPAFREQLEREEALFAEALVDDQVTRALAEFRESAPEAIAKLKGLLSEANPGVRAKAVALYLKHLAEFAPRQHIDISGTLEARLAHLDARGDTASD